MAAIKISLLLRSSELIWSYQQNNAREFWEDVQARLTDAIRPAELTHNNRGRFQHHFFLWTDKGTAFYKDLTDRIVAELLPDETQRRTVIVSVTEANPLEISVLKLLSPSTTSAPASEPAPAEPPKPSKPAKPAEDEKKDDEKPAASGDLLSSLQALMGAKAAAPQTEEPLPPASREPTRAPVAVEEKEEPGEVQPRPADAAEETSGTALSDQDRKVKHLKDSILPKIKDLKVGLLSRVRGQRHAVDEMVQTIFECEMFASQNPKRKGPLATFLFTGPSGVGKTFLAEQCGALLGRPMLVVDMTEYSDNLANNKFNGDHGQPAVVTGFVRKNPNGIIVFDEVEKAHINTIHLFLQILDAGRLMDHKVGEEVSFRDNIIIMTTNAGKELYEDSTVCDLSGTPRNVILDALRKDINPQTQTPYFPECITTRMANGHVILFNHLEPFALMEIVRDEIALQLDLFEKSSGIKVSYDPKRLAALVLYNGGGVSDARTLRGLARNILVRELQEVMMQLYAKDASTIAELEDVNITVDSSDDAEVNSLFVSSKRMYAAIFADSMADIFLQESERHNTTFEVISDSDLFKRRVRGVTDYVLIDPMCGMVDSERTPNDIEDMNSDGMRMFNYVREFMPEVPVYILDNTIDGRRSFDSLLARGAKGIIKADSSNAEAFAQALEDLSFSALINNGVYSLGRSGKYLTFNCAQYIIDASCVVMSFEKLQLRNAPLAGDKNLIARKGDSGAITFADVIGCKTAKQTLKEFCGALASPRDVALAGKRMPKGVLLYGPPGTGKTLLAKAMANECSATFFPVTATSFFGPYVGQTETAIRDLFRKARRYAPSVIFIDEVDAIGRVRTGSIGSVHNEDALNTFLAEMDGFVVDEKRPVFILAATNYELEGESGRVLDPAFVRRFDSKILVDLPDTDERFEFLTMCLKKHGIHFGENHEKILRNMAERTGGMSNADLEMMNSQFARALGGDEPDAGKYMDALDAFRFGDVNKMDPEELRQTACHESGHALVSRLCGETPAFLTVVSRGNYGGFMQHREHKSGNYTFDQLMNRVCCSLAGRIAEIELYGESKGTNTGASSDIKQARYFIRASLMDFAMGDHLYSRMRADEAEALLKKQYERTVEMIQAHRPALVRLTDLLTAKKSLDQTQLEEFFAEEGL